MFGGWFSRGACTKKGTGKKALRVGSLEWCQDAVFCVVPPYNCVIYISVVLAAVKAFLGKVDLVYPDVRLVTMVN